MTPPPSTPLRSALALALAVGLLALLVALPAAASARPAEQRSFDRADHVRVGFDYLRSRKPRTVVRFAANRIALADDGKGRLTLHTGSKRRRVARLGRRSRLRVVLDAPRQRLTLRVGGRRRVCKLRLGAERGVSVSRAGRRGRLSLTAAKRSGRIPSRRAALRRDPKLPATRGKTPAPAPDKCCANAPVSDAARPASPARPFAASSVWNQPLAASAALDPKSGIWATELRRQMNAANPWINTTQYSSPVYTVGPTQPGVKVTLDTNLWALQKAISSVPIPAGAKAAAGNDQHMVVYQPSTDTMWEFWKMHRKADGWHARWGGRMENVSKNPGYFNDPYDWGATATSLPLLGGMIRLDELKAGKIDHALAMAIPDTRAQYFTYPAQRTDGNVYSADAIPEGARFRIDPKVDLSKRRMAPMVRMMAEAAQKYGIVIRDKAGAVTFFAEDPTPLGKDPFYGGSGWFAGQHRDQMLRQQFPWDSLQVVKAEQRCCWKR